MSEWRISSGTRISESLWREEIRGSWWSESGDPAVWPPRSASGSVRRECGGSESCCSQGPPWLHWIARKGCDLDQELLVEQFQLLLLLEDVFAIESHPLSLLIGLRLLFLHFLSHLVERLKELVFVLL